MLKQEWQRFARFGEQAVLKNLLVTQGYHELSRDFARMLGPENVTWFSFASWSSKSVGTFLQEEQLPGKLLGRLERAGVTRAPLLAAVVDVRRYVSLGNTEVFGELAPAFRRFLHWFAHDDEPDGQKLERFLLTLEEGPSAPDHVATNPSTLELELVQRGGQSPLRDAVRQLYAARFESDAKRKAEHILLANAHIGVHEQTRLQTYIAAALDAPMRGLLPRASRPPVASEHIDRPPWLVNQAHVWFRRFATDRLLTLKLPDSSLRLGRDVHATPGHPLFPRVLEHIDHPELGEIFARYSQPPITCRRRRPRGARPDSYPPPSIGPGSMSLFPRAPRSSRPPPPSPESAASGSTLLRCTCGEGRLEARPPAHTVTLQATAPCRAAGSGAADWSSLDQRMRFILQLFRSRQRNQRLLEPTFSASQLAALRRGRIPHGPLS